MAARETRFEDTCEITGVKNDISAKVTLRWKRITLSYILARSVACNSHHQARNRIHTEHTDNAEAEKGASHFLRLEVSALMVYTARVRCREIAGIRPDPL